MKGKHAAESARRRAEAAHEVIDRLTDQLAEAKMRARRFEDQAGRVPALVDEIARLRRHVEEQTSDTLVRCRADLQAARQEKVEAVDAIASVMGDAIARASTTITFAPDEWGRLKALLGPTALARFLKGPWSTRRGDRSLLHMTANEMERRTMAGYVERTQAARRNNRKGKDAES